MDSAPPSNSNVQSTDTVVAKPHGNGDGNSATQLIPEQEVAASSSTTSYSLTGSTSSLSDGTSAPSVSSCCGDSTEPNSSTDNDNESVYECNICFDTAKDAVVTMCGHLFCWPCLYQWLLTRPRVKLCPVCKSLVDQAQVIPIYGRNCTSQVDPRKKVPPRPAGQRTEPRQAWFFFPDFAIEFGLGGNIYMFSPFGFVRYLLNVVAQPREMADNDGGPAQNVDEHRLSIIFFCVAFLTILWVLV